MAKYSLASPKVNLATIWDIVAERWSVHVCLLSPMTVLVGMHHQLYRPFAGSVGHANKTEGSENYINPRAVVRSNW